MATKKTRGQPISTNKSPKKFGGVKITLTRVDDAQPEQRERRVVTLPPRKGNCPCGKSYEQCDNEWDKKLGITGRSGDEYKENIRKIHLAEVEGADPYHWKQRSEVDWGGYRSDWTPFLPADSLPLLTQSIGGKDAKRAPKSRR